MKIICPYCQSKAVIGSRASQTDAVHDLYCYCKNRSCSAVFVMTLSFSHAVHQPVKPIGEVALEVLKGLPREEIERLGVYQQLGMFGVAAAGKH